MQFEVFKRVILTFLLFLGSIVSFGQIRDGKIAMEIQDRTPKNESRLLDLMIVLSNNDSENFKGKINLKSPKGFKIINGNNIEIKLKANENRYIPVKILVNSTAEAGEAKIVVKLSDFKDLEIFSKVIMHHVSDDNTLQISTEKTQIYRTGNEDSLRIAVKVSNRGNKAQNVVVVFKIPELNDGNIFIEKQGKIGVQKDSIFTFSFLPSRNLLKQSAFTVSVTGFRNTDKEIFGNANISVQNISHTQKFQGHQLNGFFNATKNSITASYRKVGENLDMYQLIGSGGFNIPSGYIFVSGNLYMINGQQDPIVNNTYISYRDENNELTVGNVSKLLEVPLFGRGAEYSFINDAKDKKIEIGFVEQSFSLIERNFLRNGYGFFVRGTINPLNYSRNISTTYIFRSDPYEKAKHNLVGTDFNYSFNNFWKASAKIFGGISHYENKKEAEPSFAAESQYSGTLNDINLNGIFFFSTDYYPGNRRGSLQIQQSVNIKVFSKHFAYANIIASNFSPKYNLFQQQLSSDNIKLESGINFAKKGNFGFGFGYHYQSEKSNTYNSFFGNPYDIGQKQIVGQRLTETINWSSKSKKHSAIINAETGFAKYPNDDNAQLQLKFTGNYNYKAFNFTTLFQYGSYYLSEYAFTKMFQNTESYRKFSGSLFYTNNFLKDKINVNSGISYTNDIVYGSSPSAFLNLKYNGRLYGVFANTSWYNYSLGSIKNNTFTIEAGITLNLQGNALNPNKKSIITAFAFYDKNNNNIFDLGEETAKDYLINISNIAFKTNAEGRIIYKNIPFGKYDLKQVIQEGWYYDEKTFDINAYHHDLMIPLHQSGTLQGRIKYEFDAKTAVSFQPRGSGIVLNIYQNDALIQRIITNDNGDFIAFLPTGTYTVSINEASLPSQTYSESKSLTGNVMAGEILSLSSFVIKVKEKKVHLKKFGS